MSDIQLYDATLSVGVLGEGYPLSVPERLGIAELLDDLGVAFIEAGRPGASSRDQAFFEAVNGLELIHGRFVALGPARQVGTSCQMDLGMLALVGAETPVVSFFESAWKAALDPRTSTSPERLLEAVEDSARYLRTERDEVIFKAHHFFDGYVEDPDFALSVVLAAVAGGANRVLLCDTLGGSLTHHLSEIVLRVVPAVEVPVGVQCANDCDLAVGNSLAAVRAGASLIEGTINGYGERCGLANLISVVPALELKLGLRCIPEGHLTLLTRVARGVDELANRAPRADQPYVGRSAFSGRRAPAASTLPPHVAPRSVGNESRVLVSDGRGGTDVLAKLRDLGLMFHADDPTARAIADRVRALESLGYQFEGAEASFRLLIAEVMGQRKDYFKLDKLEIRVDIDGHHLQRPKASGKSVARLRVQLPGAMEEGRAEGNGAIHAMDAALRQVVQPHYPSLRSVRLVDYKVRILSSGVGADSMCRVLMQSSDGEELWGTIGVSTSVVEASWCALIEALEFKLFKDGAEPLTLRHEANLQ